MTPGVYKISAQYPGDTFSGIQFAFERDGSPDDLSGVVAEFVLRHPSFLQAPVMALSSPGGITIEDNEVTILPFTLPESPADYLWTLTFDISGQRKTYMRGVLPVREAGEPDA